MKYSKIGIIQELVGGLEHFLFSHIFGIIIPIDFHIFQRGSNHQPAMDFGWIMWNHHIWRMKNRSYTPPPACIGMAFFGPSPGFWLPKTRPCLTSQTQHASQARFSSKNGRTIHHTWQFFFWGIQVTQPPHFSGRRASSLLQPRLRWASLKLGFCGLEIWGIYVWGFP